MNELEKYKEFSRDWKEIREEKKIEDKRKKIELLLQKLRIFFETHYRNSSLFQDIHWYSNSPYALVQQFGRSDIIQENANLQKRKERTIAKALLELKEKASYSKEKPMSSLKIVSKILGRFHKVARQLTYRHDKRHTLEIKDEYDVQDLLASLLKIHFDDVRPEETTPSNAGKSSRIDKLLKIEEIGIEVKMPRDNFGDKEIGDEIKVDYASYKTHPNCKSLIVFIYDPKGLLRNPVGLRRDLEDISSSDFPMKVFINP